MVGKIYNQEKHDLRKENWENMRSFGYVNGLTEESVEKFLVNQYCVSPDFKKMFNHLCVLKVNT